MPVQYRTIPRLPQVCTPGSMVEADLSSRIVHIGSMVLYQNSTTLYCTTMGVPTGTQQLADISLRAGLLISVPLPGC